MVIIAAFCRETSLCACTLGPPARRYPPPPTSVRRRAAATTATVSGDCCPRRSTTAASVRKQQRTASASFWTAAAAAATATCAFLLPACPLTRPCCLEAVIDQLLCSNTACLFRCALLGRLLQALSTAMTDALFNWSSSAYLDEPGHAVAGSILPFGATRTLRHDAK